MRRENRVAVVTGAGGNIGAGIARQLAQDGVHVVLVDMNGRAGPVAARLASEGLSAEAADADLADEAAILDLARTIEAGHGRFDILVNNAAISAKRDGPRWEVPLEEWDAVFRVNITAPFLLARSAIPLMIRAGWGRIVNISSQAGRTQTLVAGLHYGSSKAALIGLTRLLASAVGQHGITVNAVAPGPMDLVMPSWPNAAPPAAPDPGRQKSLGNYAIPAGRLGTAQDIAAAVGFLASDAAGFVTGAVLDVNGGAFMG